MEHKGTKRLETDRLILRRYTEADAEPMYRNWASDPEVSKFLTWPTHSSIEVTRSLITDWIARYENPDYYNWVIELKEIGEIVGNISVVQVKEKTEAAEIGYCMGKAWWGRGIMPEALKEVMRYLFDEVGMNRVAACHSTYNPKSGRVMQKAGMKYEGTLRAASRNNQGIHDIVWYGLLKSDREQMTLHKHEIPILEYDDSQESVIMPTHQNLEIKLPEKLIYAFLGDMTDNYAKKNHLVQVAQFVSETKLYPVYVTEYKGEQIGICQAPVGSAAATQILDWLIGYGAKKVLATGCCGALVDLPENLFLVPTKALRDEGTSYHYLPPARYVEINPEVLKKVESAMNKLGLQYKECVTWTTDGFYRETGAMVEYRREEGCAVVEMECSALAACAQFRRAEFSQILFTADTLVNVEAYDERSWGENSLEKALYICLDVIGEM